MRSLCTWALYRSVSTSSSSSAPTVGPMDGGRLSSDANGHRARLVGHLEVLHRVADREALEPAELGEVKDFPAVREKVEIAAEGGRGSGSRSRRIASYAK